jgi:hypothetical protein
MPPSRRTSANVGVAGVPAPEQPSRKHPEQQNAQEEPQQVQQSLIAYFEANVARKKRERLYTWHGTAQCAENVVWSYTDVARRGQTVCVALRMRWDVSDGARVMLIYPPGLDFLAAFFGCQYAALIAVPYYPPIIPASPMAGAGAKKMLADGLAKVVHIYDSCHPEMLLSTTMCAFCPASQLRRPLDTPAAAKAGTCRELACMMTCKLSTHETCLLLTHFTPDPAPSSRPPHHSPHGANRSLTGTCA